MPHMTVSPFDVNGLVDGETDGARDAERVREGLPPVGMDPAKSWSVRYQRGYAAAFGGE